MIDSFEKTRLLPLLFVAYFVCYLDRINVGFAALTMNFVDEKAIETFQDILIEGGVLEPNKRVKYQDVVITDFARKAIAGCKKTNGVHATTCQAQA